MVSSTKDLDLDALRARSSSTVVASLGSRLTALANALRRSAPHADAVAPHAEQTMIKPSPHERVAIEAHRDDQ